MKLTVKTLKGTHCEIRVNPSDTVMAVKKKIEEIQGKDSYPCGQQLLIHSGKVLKDDNTLEENKVSEDGFLVVMLSKTKTSGAGGSSSSQPSATDAPAQLTTTEAPPQAQPTTTEAPPQAPAPANPSSVSEGPPPTVPGDACGQAASSLVGGSNLEQIANQLMDMGGGNWDKDKVLRALRAAYNNPERAVEYLYLGIPTTAEVAVPVARFPSSQTSSPGADTTEATAIDGSPLAAVPNSSPFDMFPQGAPSPIGGARDGSLAFLRQNQQFQELRALVQANPQILQSMLQEVSKQNPLVLRLIQEHNAEFLQLLNEPVEGAEDDEGDMFDQPEEEMPHAISVTPEEQHAIEQLESMGFDRARVIEAFLACDRNDQLAANYLLEHAGDED